MSGKSNKGKNDAEDIYNKLLSVLKPEGNVITVETRFDAHDLYKRVTKEVYHPSLN